MAHPFVATMIGGDLEDCDPSQPRFAESTPFHGADGADALQGIGQQCPSFVAMLIGGGLEMRSLAAVGGPKIGIISRRRRSGRPPGNLPAMALRLWQR